MTKKYVHSGTVWPWGIAAVLTVFIAINIGFITVALRHRPQLVSDNYYAEGYNLKDIVAREAASKATGWNVEVRCLPLSQADMPLVELRVTEANGQPCDSLVGEVGFYRPSDKTLDINPRSIQYVGTGRYLVYLPQALGRGAWQAHVILSRDKQEFVKRVNLFVD